MKRTLQRLPAGSCGITSANAGSSSALFAGAITSNGTQAIMERTNESPERPKRKIGFQREWVISSSADNAGQNPGQTYKPFFSNHRKTPITRKISAIITSQ